MLAFVVIMTFPLANHSLRDSLITLVWDGKYTVDNAPTDVFLGWVRGPVWLALQCHQCSVISTVDDAPADALLAYLLPLLELAAPTACYARPPCQSYY